jgi:hypothetical protein
MRRLDLNLPTFGFIVATRAALGLGIGLLLSSRIPESRRRTTGLALVAIGVATTIPALIAALRGMETAELPPHEPSRAASAPTMA